MSTPTTGEREALVSRAAMITIGTNILVTLARALAGWYSGSTAVLADAANSGTDVLATLVVLGGARIAARPADESHPYGHEKAEPVAAKLVGLLVAFTGVATALAAARALRTGSLEEVGLSAAWVTAGSIAVKEILSRYLVRVSRLTGSQALMADAVNQRTDVLGSAAALAGALGGRFGLPILDPAMGLLVAGLILRMGLGLYWRAVTDLMDPAPDPATLARLTEAASAVPGVLALDEVRARVFGAGLFVDCKIRVDGKITVEEGHGIAAKVKEAMARAVPACRGVLVHVNPG